MNVYKCENCKGNIFYVVAGNPNDAASKIKKWLDDQDRFFRYERDMVVIELVAEPYPDQFKNVAYFVEEASKKP